MGSSALSVLSGVAAAAAGFAGEKVAKNGSIPGLDLASIVPALLGKAGGGGAGGILAGLASVAAKSGLLDSSKLVSLAGSLLSTKTEGTAAKTETGGLIGLASAIAGNSGSGANLGKIAKMALSLAETAKNNKEVIAMASKLGKTLGDKFGISLNVGQTALKGLDKILEGDDKADMFKAILKGLV